MNAFDILKERRMIEQMTDEAGIEALFAKNTPIVFYVGFDATADSLHVGHFLQLSIMRLLQKCGHHPIVLIGGGTTLVGDPTGRTDMRSMMTNEIIRHNSERFQVQMSKFFDIGPDQLTFVNNADWLCDLKYIDFIREYGVHFSVNRMLAADAFRARMERGLSFFELNYMLMQSYDFLHLFREYGCVMQLGGNDQWSNIIAGVNLIRRITGQQAYGMTFQLLTTSEGTKMGKTAKGALWLDRDKTSPYEFYQYWRNIADDDVANSMRLLTELPMSEIAAVESAEGADINTAKELLAYLLTERIHGKDDAEAAQKASRSLFSGSGEAEDMPTTMLSSQMLFDGVIEVSDLLIRTGLTSSKGEGKRLIEQGGILLNDKKVDDIYAIVTEDELRNTILIKKGKKRFHRVLMEE